ncbi:MAG: LysM peptidoglycan-binding domain-containing protein [bacterium]|nr:LysM peptidoglycan-binding domain-containing protein [bacterium]
MSSDAKKEEAVKAEAEKFEAIKTEPKKAEKKAEKKVEPVKKAEPVEEEGAEYYTVEEKDDLIKISEKLLGDHSKWKLIYNANRDKIKNPILIFPGQRLKIPR